MDRIAYYLTRARLDAGYGFATDLEIREAIEAQDVTAELDPYPEDGE